MSISGRAKDLVISGGLDVYLEEIKLLFDGIDDVVDSARRYTYCDPFDDASCADEICRQHADQAVQPQDDFRQASPTQQHPLRTS